VCVCVYSRTRFSEVCSAEASLNIIHEHYSAVKPH